MSKLLADDWRIVKWRGWPIHCEADSWIYSDNRTPVSDQPARMCGRCKRQNRPDDHDACIGELKGVRNACCGHGVIADAYVQFLDGRELRGNTAVDWFAKKEGGDT